MRLGRRPLFFLGVAVVSLLLVIPTPSDFRWVNYTMTGIASFWFIMLSFEEILGQRDPSEPAGTDDRAGTDREERS